MENVREHSGNVWREEIPHYNGAEEQGFQPLAMDPAEAWQRLRDAYDGGQDEATRELLQSWGIEMEPCGAPVLRELISQAGPSASWEFRYFNRECAVGAGHQFFWMGLG